MMKILLIVGSLILTASANALISTQERPADSDAYFCKTYQNCGSPAVAEAKSGIFPAGAP
jgi:hypothetical protein